MAGPKVSSGIPLVDKAIAALTSTSPSPLDGIRLIENVSLVSGQTKRIVHGLKRKLRGYLVVKSSAGAAMGYMYDEQLLRADTDIYLYLRTEGYSPTISLLVF